MKFLGELNYNAEGLVLGRLASVVARNLLRGYRVNVINVEKAIITGDPVMIKREWYQKWARSDWYHGPFYPRMPDRIFRRVVRGMLPRKTKRGREALKNLRVFIGFPDEFKDKPLLGKEPNEKAKQKYHPKLIEEAKKTQPKFERGNIKYLELGELSKWLGAKF